jgi:hypothetical protein
MMQTYKESGKVGAMTVPGVVGCVAVGVGLAWLYQKLIDWIPLIYVNFLVTLGFGIALGAVVAALLRATKNRSRAIMIVAVAATATVADAASFYWSYRNAVDPFYEEVSEAVRALGEEPVTREEFEERLTFDQWREMRVEMGWSVGAVGSSDSGKPTMSGLFVYAVWLLELVALLFLSYKAAAGAHAAPFCETCGEWMAGQPLEPWADVDAEALRRAAERQEKAPLLAPRPAAKASGEIGSYQVYACPRCGQGGVAEVAVAHVETDKKGNTQVKRDVLVPLVVTSAERDALLAYAYPGAKAEPAKTTPAEARA